jgi:alpha-glucosidase (family GH31 glycosyl hydrolase)
MGDDGFLKRLRAELRRFNVVGDTTWLKGKVTQKYVKDGEHLYGLGERFTSFDLRGRRHVLQTEDAIGNNSSFRSYKPVPLLLSSAGYGVFINTASRTLVDAREDRCLIACRGPLDMWLLSGTPKEITESIHAAAKKVEEKYRDAIIDRYDKLGVQLHFLGFEDEIQE